MLSSLLENFHFRALETWRTFGLTSWSPRATTALATELGGKELVGSGAWTRAYGQRSPGPHPTPCLLVNLVVARCTAHFPSCRCAPPFKAPFSMRVGGAPGGRQVHRSLSFSCHPTPPFRTSGRPAKISLDLVRPPPYSHPRTSREAGRKNPLTMSGGCRIVRHR